MVLDAQLQISEAGQPDRIVAVRDSVTIGRDSDNDIVLESNSVSRYHAVLLRRTVGLVLVDLGSTNGTLLNGRPVLPDEPLRLRDGDEIQFGHVVARYAAPPNAPLAYDTFPVAHSFGGGGAISPD